MPVIAADPELAAEVAEMQGEVQRCKAIVTDILHSAGQPRSEPLERVAASTFVAAVAEEWRPTHADTPFTLANATGATTIIAEPALRQAVWSLLDNAAEASPAGLALDCRIEGEMLAITVRDRGPGFAPAALEHVGKLYQSTKGAGHGLGLFLATNLARRLGGRLDARNRDGGGAEVTLLLPLARQES
jgi:two-component system sensor histidine kinase RegB